MRFCLNRTVVTFFQTGYRRGFLLKTISSSKPQLGQQVRLPNTLLMSSKTQEASSLDKALKKAPTESTPFEMDGEGVRLAQENVVKASEFVSNVETEYIELKNRLKELDDLVKSSLGNPEILKETRTERDKANERLKEVHERLKEARASLKEANERLKEAREYYRSLIKLAMKDDPFDSKSFSEADSSWIQSVTQVNTDFRLWTGYTIDVNIQPRPGFKEKFEEVAKAFHQSNEAGRRIFLNLFLSDVILRDEFGDNLRIYLEVKMIVESIIGPKKLRLQGTTDYTVGRRKGINIFDKSIPQELNLVAVEAKTKLDEDDLWQCVAEAASLYKTRVDAGEVNRSVWGILSNAVLWQFVLIDDAGQLWISDYFILNLLCYDESKVLQVYRMIHYIMKCCHEAITDPPSLPPSVVSRKK